MQLLIPKPEKKHQNRYNFPFAPPSLFCALYFVLFSFSCNQNFSLLVLSQRQMKRMLQQIFLCTLMRWALRQPASVFKHINPLGLPGLLCLILVGSSFLQMLLFCVKQGKYNLLLSSQLPQAQLHALNSWPWQIGLPAAQGVSFKGAQHNVQGKCKKTKEIDTEQDGSQQKRPFFYPQTCQS